MFVLLQCKCQRNHLFKFKSLFTICFWFRIQYESDFWKEFKRVKKIISNAPRPNGEKGGWKWTREFPLTPTMEIEYQNCFLQILKLQRKSSREAFLELHLDLDFFKFISDWLWQLLHFWRHKGRFNWLKEVPSRNDLSLLKKSITTYFFFAYQSAKLNSGY
jgi:hypothetical protein